MSSTLLKRDALLRTEGVSCAYDSARSGFATRRGGHAHAVLSDITIDILAGDLVGIVGPSGSGKTTLLRVLLGSMTPAVGRVIRRPGLRLGYVPQVETVDWTFPVTVGECVLMARTTGRRLPWRSADERREVEHLLGLLGLSDLVDRHIRQLSGGQQQRVFIARALLGHPHVLLMDEPTSGVDVKTRHEILHLLSALSADGLTIVLTTHDLNGIAAHLPSLVCLNRRVIAAGPPEDVLVPDVLEATYGAPMDVLEHGGLRVVVDTPRLSGAGLSGAGPGGTGSDGTASDSTASDGTGSDGAASDGKVVPFRRIAG